MGKFAWVARLALVFAQLELFQWRTASLALIQMHALSAVHVLRHAPLVLFQTSIIVFLVRKLRTFFVAKDIENLKYEKLSCFFHMFDV